MRLGSLGKRGIDSCDALGLDLVVNCYQCSELGVCPILRGVKMSGVYVGCNRHELVKPGYYRADRCLAKALSRVFDFRSHQATIDARMNICVSLGFNNCEWIVAASIGLEPMPGTNASPPLTITSS